MPYTSNLDFGPYGNWGTISLPTNPSQENVMPPVVIGAGIAAASALASAKMASNAQKNASQSQTEATDKALAFQREQEATRKANFDRAYSMWDASRRALLQRYGIELPASAPAATMGMAAGAAPAGMTSQGVGARPISSPVAAANLGQIIQQPADLGGWSDWQTYGLGRRA